MRFAALAVLLCCVLACNTPSDDVGLDERKSAFDRAIKYDIDGQPDSVVVLLDAILNDDRSGAVDDYIKLIYCRSLFAIGRIAQADSAYSTYSAREKLSAPKGALVSEYLTLLVKSEQYDRACAYADTLIGCCSDDKNKYFDLALMCYVVRADHNDSCKELVRYLDSLEAMLRVIPSPIVTLSTLNDWKRQRDEHCPF